MRGENPCYQKHTGVNGSDVPIDNLRLEMDSNSFYLLPYHHLELVKFESGEGQDTLTLSFLNRTVRITGKNLRDVGLGLQGRCIEFVRVMPSLDRYSSVVKNESLIKAIEIEQKEDGHA